MKLKGVALFISSIVLSSQVAFCVPQKILDQYDDICWSCYSPEISIQNFLNKYRETLRNLCYRNDAKACEMVATLYSSLQNDFDANEYWHKACELGKKDACAHASND